MMAPRATQLAAQAEAGLTALLETADAYGEESLGETWHHRRVADVLAHLFAWHMLFEGWVSQARAGSVPALPAEGYTWDTLEDLNRNLYEQHRADSYPTVRASLVASHQAMINTVADCTQEELTEPDAFPWLGGGTLGDIAHECLGAHYEWACSVLKEAGFE